MTDPQKDYLRSLRTGDLKHSLLNFYDDVTQISQQDINNDIDNYATFLDKFGLSSETHIVVKREDVVALLDYLDNRECLVLQNCFGFDTFQPIESENMPPQQTTYKVGKMLLIHKGNFWLNAKDVAGGNDEGFFTGDTRYKDQNNNLDLFRDMNFNSPLTEDEARQYVNNFFEFHDKMLDKREPTYIHGYMLPVKLLRTIFTSPAYSFSPADDLFIVWGLTSPYGKLGNFSFFIGTAGLLDTSRTGPVIICRDPAFSGSSENDCPPHPGCAI